LIDHGLESRDTEKSRGVQRGGETSDKGGLAPDAEAARPRGGLCRNERIAVRIAGDRGTNARPPGVSNREADIFAIGKSEAAAAAGEGAELGMDPVKIGRVLGVSDDDFLSER
jgi:hypothetical protein